MRSSEELSCAQLKAARGERGPASRLHLQIDADLAQLYGIETWGAVALSVGPGPTPLNPATGSASRGLAAAS